MPELPEVETIRTDLSKKILNHRIKVVRVFNVKTVGGEKNKLRLKRVLADNSFAHIARRGKLLLFELSGSKFFLGIHLKMTGQLLYVRQGLRLAGGHSFGRTTTELPNTHTRLSLQFADGGTLFFNDARLFGYVKLFSTEEKEKVVQAYGLEPLSKEFTRAAWKKLILGKKGNIKAFFLNQKYIAGIGNIYADEICHGAHILPTRRLHSLTPKEITSLHSTIRRVLTVAVHHRGTTFNNYVDSEGRMGSFLKHLRVYDRAGQRCKTCRRGIIKKSRHVGRGTHWCAVCQI